uniref:Uncharacterized protein n=1 Tax=Oryza nivara TaxID=4536 RepID=A0A0E0ILX7_ORYNI
MEGGQPIRIYCKGDTTLNVAVRGNELRLVRDDPNDESQVCDGVGKLTDDEERPAFALVNRTTGHALVNGGDLELGLAPYSGHVAVELSVLWSLGHPRADGFMEIRTLRDVRYTLDGVHGFVDGGYRLNGIHGIPEDGTLVAIYHSQPTADYAVWKIAPVGHQEPHSHSESDDALES